MTKTHLAATLILSSLLTLSACSDSSSSAPEPRTSNDTGSGSDTTDTGTGSGSDTTDTGTGSGSDTTDTGSGSGSGSDTTDTTDTGTGSGSDTTDTGTGSDSDATQVPATPSNINLEALGKYRQISWEAVEGATSYNLYWDTSSFSSTNNAHKISNVSTPYTHEELSAETVFYYALTSQNEAGESPLSEVKTLHKPITEIDAPDTLTATTDDSSIKLYWDVHPMLTYDLYWSTTANVDTSSNKISDLTSTYEHVALEANTYYYRIIAKSGEVSSPLSNEVSAVIAEIPEPLTKVSKLNISENAGKLQLSWDAVTNAEAYKVYIATSVFDDLSAANEYQSSSNSYEHPISAEATYYVRVVAIKGTETSEASELSLFNYETDPQKETGSWLGKNYSVELTGSTANRTYRFNTDENIRYASDVSYGNGQRDISEDTSKLYSRTGNLMFDGLLALAMEEVKEDSVDKISDWSFADADCQCFETGRKWKYVWTRDTAYSVDLAMAAIDPQRSSNSLSFKLSTGRNDSNWEIVQDTGTGGSWPVSSDRSTWSFGGKQTLNYLMEPERSTFRDKTYIAVKNTIARDRIAVFDQRDGLYYGEQSFLDWREQTYPTWTADNGTVHIGMSKSLSTNVAHYQLLKLATELATEKGENQAASDYQAMADALKTAINDELWLEDAGMYSTMTTTEFDPAATHKYDALGEALAIITGVADATQAQQIIKNYPHSQAGVPVIWPQQPETFVYHNRAIWPFVSAYVLKAAVIANNDSVVNHNIKSLMRGSALNLSNMENFEYLTQNNADTDLNSQRQLWSVAAYVAMVQDVIFGQQASGQGISFTPYITAYMRNELFTKQSQIELNNIEYQGKVINLKVALPPPSQDTQGVYAITASSLNGVELQGEITPAMLEANNTVLITLGALETANSEIALIADENDQQSLFAPKEPSLAYPSLENGKVTLSFSNRAEVGTTFSIYRNGEKVAENIAGSATSWTDDNSSDYTNTSYCYALEQVFTSSGNVSHHSAPQCYWPTGAVTSFTPDSGLSSLDGASTEDKHGKNHYNYWGNNNQQLQASFTAQSSRLHYLQTTYSNALNQINTGITAAVKTITVKGDDGSEQSGIVYMPHLQEWSDWGDSNLVPFNLKQGVTYTIIISDFFNMTYLKHFESYTGNGGSEAVNRANIAALKILKM